MAKIFLVIITCFLTLRVNAECGAPALWAYPAEKQIKQNSWIVLEEYNFRPTNILDSLNTRYPVYLQSRGHRVRLLVIEVCNGMFNLKQAVLMPEETLVAGETYTLQIDRLSGEDKDLPFKMNYQTWEREPYSWLVTPGADTQAPDWLKKPALKSKATHWYGCGPAVNAIFDLKVTEAQSQVLVKTEWVDLETNTIGVYYLSTESDGLLYVGHDMCSGAFVYTPKHTYKVRFSLMDFSGNKNEIWTDWVSFDSPFEDIGSTE